MSSSGIPLGCSWGRDLQTSHPSALFCGDRPVAWEQANYGAFIGVVALVGNCVSVRRPRQREPAGKGCFARSGVSFAASLGKGATDSHAASGSVLVGGRSPGRHVLPCRPTIPLRLVLLVSVSDLFGLNITTNCGQAFQAM